MNFKNIHQSAKVVVIGKKIFRILNGIYWLIKNIYKHPLTSNNKLITFYIAFKTFINLTIQKKIIINWVNKKKLIIHSKKDFSTIFNHLFVLFDYIEMKFLSKILSKNMIFLDIGANSGVYSVLASSYCKKIYSFEPNIKVFKNLIKNLKLNKIKNICLNIGIGKDNSIARITKNLGDQNYIINKKKLNIPSYKIQLKNIDSFKFKKKKLVIKIDVEGHELDVLIGSKKTFYQNKLIIIIIEMNYKKSNLKKIQKFLKSHKFVNIKFDLKNNKILSKNKISRFNEIYTNNYSLLKKMFHNTNNNIIYKDKII